MKKSERLYELVLTRRRVLMAGGALGFAGLIGSPAWVLAAGETPVRGGILTTNLLSDPPNLDPLSNSSGRVLQVIAPCYNSLVMMDPLHPDQIIGDLAEDWSVSDDLLTYTFRLHDGVKFHDGVALTSADVVHTFEVMRNPPEGVVSLRQGSLETVDSIEAVDPLTVAFRLKRPYPAFLATLATGWMFVLPKHVLEAGGLADTVVGSGPFKLAKATPGVSFELVRNSDYHIADRPYLDGITLYVIPERSTVFANFRTGNIDYYDGMGGEEARMAQQEFPDKAVIQSGPGYTFGSVTFNTTQGPWTDIRLRKAASLAIDRNAALQVLLQGHGVIGGSMPPGPWALPQADLAAIAGYAGEREANLAEAKQLMAEAGFPDGFKTQLLTKKTGTHEARAVFVKDQLLGIGVDAQIVIKESAAYVEDLLNRDFEVTAYGYSPLVNDPEAVFGDFYACEAALNASGFCDDDLTALFERQKTLDGAERLAVVRDLERQHLAQFSDLMLFWRNRFLGHGKWVHNLMLHPEQDNNRRMQDVWLAPRA